jgi:hypothetical protein
MNTVPEVVYSDVTSPRTAAPSSGTSSGGLFGNLIGLIGSNYLNNQQQSAFGNTIQGYGNLANQLQSQVQFKPFTVTGTTGGIGTGYDAQGNLQTQYNLSPQGQAIQQAGLGGAERFLTEAQAPIAQTEQDIFNRMLQIAAPERERQQLALEERLAAQGRLGTSSAAYGGATPEQMAMAAAQQEQLNQLGLQARGQALQERGQALEMGRGLMSAGLAPESQLLNLIQPSINLASLQGTGQREGANLNAQLQIAQLQAQQNAALAEAQRKQQMLSGGVGLLTGQRQGGQQSILDQILGGIFGGGGGGGSTASLQDLLNYQAPNYQYNPTDTGGLNFNLNYDPNASYGMLGGGI